jgi:hypothetical protein
MQLGCPVLASDIPAVAEACADAAHLVDCRSIREIAEGLLQVVEDDRLRAGLCARGLRRAGQLSLRNYREQLGAFLRQYVSVPAAPSYALPHQASDVGAREMPRGGGPAAEIPSASER